VLEQAAMRSDSVHIDVPALEEVLRESGIQRIEPPPHAAPRKKPAAGSLRPLAEQVAEVEREAIEAAMAATSGNKLAAARLLGISRAKLYERLDTTV
jgi:DNA-binding NtrC family response regulator